MAYPDIVSGVSSPLHGVSRHRLGRVFLAATRLVAALLRARRGPRPAPGGGFVHDVEHVVQDGRAQVQFQGEEGAGDVGEGVLRHALLLGELTLKITAAALLHAAVPPDCCSTCSPSCSTCSPTAAPPAARLLLHLQPELLLHLQPEQLLHLQPEQLHLQPEQLHLQPELLHLQPELLHLQPDWQLDPNTE
ncbi:hypothetical protein EYF80_051126 [Liparis tanakae]|uniref:Uncharacterized protein n=1 Tax=Liparis tanakae TaxID=230148 RepID=A0A4Z2FCM8_9TELE|nr:hypothetical protein EYF80_051126 [Liparis tanakae]